MANEVDALLQETTERLSRLRALMSKPKNARERKELQNVSAALQAIAGISRTRARVAKSSRQRGGSICLD